MTHHTCTSYIADYYPFGMEIQRGFVHTQPPAGNLLNNRYLYNGKEYQDDFGLNWYDYGARFYDPQIARFHTLDPLAENFAFQSPYACATNNPIRFIDYMGMNAEEPDEEEQRRQQEQAAQEAARQAELDELTLKIKEIFANATNAQESRNN